MSITVKRPEKIVEFCTDLGLQSEWESAGEELKTLRKREDADARMTGESKKVRDLKKRIQELENQMQDSIVVFTLRALPRKRWVELKAEHPVREGREDDRQIGANLETFIDAVLREPGTIVSTVNKASGEPIEFNPRTDWMPLAEEMTNAQWDVFSVVVYSANQGSVTPGFNQVAWQKTQR